MTDTGRPATTPPDSGGIVVDHVSRSFGSVLAVRDASFIAPAGQVTGLIGPNGSGKTTLMLMLASLLAPERGSIRVAGHDPLTETAAVRSQLGWMPDVLGSWPSLTVRSALRTTGRLYGMSADAAAVRAEQLITDVGLAELADRRTKVLSRGQKQKLSLARALVHDPSVLLLDEPASGLDPVARVELREIVRGLAAQGKTVLVSSHVLAELDEMADSAVYIAGGVTADAGRVEEAKSSARPWRLRVVEGNAMQALVAAGVDAAAVAYDRGELLVPLATEAAAADLLTTLVGQGLRVSVFAPAVGDLEHAFLDLSRGDLRRHDPDPGGSAPPAAPIATDGNAS